MQNCIEVPDFLTGLVWETRVTLSIQKKYLVYSLRRSVLSPASPKELWQPLALLSAPK